MTASVIASAAKPGANFRVVAPGKSGIESGSCHKPRRRCQQVSRGPRSLLVEPAAQASGSQVWNGNMGSLTAKAMKKPVA